MRHPSAPMWLSLLYLLTFAADLLGMYQSGLLGLHYAAKPLLMPLLMLLLYSLKQPTGQSNWRWILAGLAFSWAGDVLLMFQDRSGGFFIAGLACFLTTHILYIIYFLRYKPMSFSSDNWFSQNRLLSIMVVAYAVIFLGMMVPNLGGMMIPVALYTFCITVMLLQALASHKRVQPQAYGWLVAGAALFVLSDSVLAYNKFMKPFAMASILIMTTYVAAQWLIVQGTLRNTDPLPIPEKF